MLSATGKGHVQGRVEVGVQYFQPIDKGALAQLKELHLGFNEISDIGVGHITKAVKTGWLPQIEVDRTWRAEQREGLEPEPIERGAACGGQALSCAHEWPARV